MINFKVDVSVDYKSMGFEEQSKAELTAYILDKSVFECVTWQKRPAIIICPGGGYNRVSPREAEPIALKYCSAGFHSFVLDYSVAPIGWPAACSELSKSVAYVRSIADEYNIDKDKIIVCGFSAGGHLAASIGVHYDKDVVKKYSGVTDDENRPNGMILAYPVITGDKEKTHMGTYDNFIAGRESAVEYVGLENHATANTPKAFIWHTYEDACVPVDSSMRFASALLENKVQYELHIYPEGGHGLSLANEVTSSGEGGVRQEVQPWIDMSIRWVNNL